MSVRPRLSRYILVAATVLFSPMAAFGQLGSDPVAPDQKRLIVPLDEALYFAAPGRLRGDLQHTQTMTEIASSDAPGTGEVGFDTSQLNLRLQPALIWAPRASIQVMKLVMDMEFTVTPKTEEADLLRADPWELDTALGDPFLITQSYGLVLHTHYALLVGLVRPLFGLGMLANPGNNAALHSVRRSPYGARRAGDRVMRAQVSWMPLAGRKRVTNPNGYWETNMIVPISVSLATDDVHHDDNVRAAEGDEARQYSAGVRLQGETLMGTLGFIARDQTHGEGGETSVMSAVSHLSGAIDIKAGQGHLTLWGEGEFALLQGQSTYSQSAIRPAPLDILGAGGILRLGATHSTFEFTTELGYASGDSNAFDREGRSFRFDRNYQVGTLLFRQASRASTAVSASNLQDPTYRAAAPRGYDTVANGGAIENAMYVNPRAAYRVFDWASLNAGYLYGRMVTPWSDPYQSGLRGGVATGPRGAEGATALGDEVTLGLDLSYRIARIGFTLRTWASWFRPGAAFATADGDDADDKKGAWTSLEVNW